MQNWDLDKKISLSLTKIAEFYNVFPHQIYISLSGGKDSTVLCHLVRKLYPDTPAVFIDTGLEYPEVKKFALSQENVIRLKPEMNFRKVIETYGYPLISKEVSQKIYEARSCPNGSAASRFDPNSEHNIKYNHRYSMAKYKYLLDSDLMISHKCCHIMKKKPAKKFEKETGLHPITGIMACESILRKSNWVRYGCNAFDGERPVSNPLSFWTEQDVLEYIVKYNLPYASVYGEIKQNEEGKYYTTGCERTGCVYCGFGIHKEKEPTRFQKLKQTHPQLWEYCMRDWKDGGLGMKKLLEYIDVKYE